MGEGTTRSLVSLFTLVLLFIGSVATAMGVLELGSTGNEQVGEEYIIPAAVGNTLCVLFLIFLTATIPTRSVGYKLVVISLLLIGLVAEIYLTLYVEKMPYSIGTYFVIAVNFLIRAFYVLEYVQDSWAPITFGSTTVASVTKAVEKAVAPTPSRPSQSDSDDDRKREFVARWDKIWTKIRDSPEGLTTESRKDAWESVIKPAIEEKKFTAENLKEAAAKLRHADGTNVPLASLDIRGGRKR